MREYMVTFTETFYTIAEDEDEAVTIAMETLKNCGCINDPFKYQVEEMDFEGEDDDDG